MTGVLFTCVVSLCSRHAKCRPSLFSPPLVLHVDRLRCIGRDSGSAIYHPSCVSRGCRDDRYSDPCRVWRRHRANDHAAAVSHLATATDANANTNTAGDDPSDANTIANRAPHLDTSAITNRDSCADGNAYSLTNSEGATDDTA